MWSTPLHAGVSKLLRRLPPGTAVASGLTGGEMLALVRGVAWRDLLGTNVA
jgi:hypothetical protein